MKRIILLAFMLGFVLTSYSQEKGTFKDARDGKVYKTVKIGTLTMMAENLAYKPSSGNYWVYGNKKSPKKYGYLYDWETAKIIAPAGWHLPTKEEWEILHKFLGGDNRIVYLALKEGGSSCFNALFGGCRDNNGNFYLEGSLAYFWTSTKNGDAEAWTFSCVTFGVANLLSTKLNCGNSVRLFRD